MEHTYERVLEDLRAAILSGEFRAGAQLPSVRELANRYDTSVGTAGRVVRELGADGLVVTRQGSGVFVRTFAAIPRSSPGRLAKERWGAGQSIQDADTRQRSRTVDVETGERPLPGWAAEALSLPEGATGAMRSRRFVVDDRPVQLAVSYHPVEIARGTQIMHTDTGPGGTYARLAEMGHEPVRFTEYLRARMPTSDERRRLDLPRGTPVIEVTRHAFEDAGRCVAVDRMILDGTAYLLDYSFTA